MRFRASLPGRSPLFLAAMLALALSALAHPLRAQSDGDPDPGYGVGGSTSHSQSGEVEPTGIACAPDGTCYLGIPNTNSDFRVRRITSDGSYVDLADAAFNLGGANEDVPVSIAVGADGKPVLVGYASDATDNLIALARFTPSPGPNLVLDGAFSGDGKAIQNFNGNATGWGVAVGPSGETVAVGPYQSGGSTGTDFAVVRLLVDGTPDNNFDGNGVRTLDFNHSTSVSDDDYATAVAIQADGKIVVAGFARFSSSDYDFAVARLNLDGSLDATFSPTGVAGMETVFFDQGTSDRDEARSVAIDRFGRILLAGRAETDAGYKPALARLTAGGVLDSTFDGDGKFLGAEGVIASAVGLAVLPFPSERILYLTAGGSLVALTEAGAFDPGFGSAGVVIVVHPDATTMLSRDALTTVAGMPVVVGTATAGATPYSFVARYWMAQIFGDDFESGGTNGWSWPGR